KVNRWKWPLVWALTIFGIAGIPTYLLWEFSKVQIPTPAMAGFNDLSIVTAAAMAKSQFEAGNVSVAAKHFKEYFQMGGKDPEMMKAYAKSLADLGLQDEAAAWALRAQHARANSAQ
ncbi:MAG: hypothetical protein AB7F86_19265, partial [Bdellovibrionales bacterium]